MSAYWNLVLRNEGYVSKDLQEKIRRTKILFAGVGVASTIAEAAVRIGFEKFTLADGDNVELHNLNRQAFSLEDIGMSKVAALARRLKGINPDIEVVEHVDWITNENAAGLVRDCDLIFDTIDFLDLAAITALHDEAHVARKPIISSVSAGWGGAACYFPPTETEGCAFRRLFGLPNTGSVENASYVTHFAHFIDRIREELDPAVAQAMAKALTVMEDGTTCPAPHVSAGSFAVASLAITLAARILNGDKVTAAPFLIVANMSAICAEGGIDLTPEM
jgi:molybdopterin/thiamine biosynthesis adenylyltransferase